MVIPTLTGLHWLSEPSGICPEYAGMLGHADVKAMKVLSKAEAAEARAAEDAEVEDTEVEDDLLEAEVVEDDEEFEDTGDDEEFEDTEEAEEAEVVVETRHRVVGRGGPIHEDRATGRVIRDELSE